MKLETSEEEREEAKRWYNKDAFSVRSARDIDTLLAEVERLRKEYELVGEQINELETEEEASSAEIARLRAELDRAPPLPAEVEEMRVLLLQLAEWKQLVGLSISADLRDAASLLSRWPGVWRPIETAPKDGTRVMVYRADYAENTSIAYWSHDYGDWFTDPGGWTWNPTHWSPLPESPHE